VSEGRREEGREEGEEGGRADYTLSLLNRPIRTKGGLYRFPWPSTKPSSMIRSTILSTAVLLGAVTRM